MCDNIITACIQYTLHRSEVTTHHCTWWPHRGVDSRDGLSLHIYKLVGLCLYCACMALYCHSNSSLPHGHTHTIFQSTHVFSVFQPYSTRYYKLQLSPHLHVLTSNTAHNMLQHSVLIRIKFSAETTQSHPRASYS